MVTKAPMPKVLTLRDVEVTLDGVNYARSLDKFELVPASSTVTWQGMSPDASFSAAEGETFSVNLSGVQDWDDEASLVNVLWNRAGETVPAIFKPRAEGAASFAMDVVLATPAAGGAVSGVAPFSVTLGVSGKPRRTFATTPTP